MGHCRIARFLDKRIEGFLDWGNIGLGNEGIGGFVV